MTFFDQSTVGLKDKEMRDTMAFQIQRIASVGGYDRKLDVMLRRPGES